MNLIFEKIRACSLVPESREEREGKKKNKKPNGNTYERCCQKLASQSLQEHGLSLKELEPECSSEHLVDQKANWVHTKVWKL